MDIYGTGCELKYVVTKSLWKTNFPSVQPLNSNNDFKLRFHECIGVRVRKIRVDEISIVLNEVFYEMSQMKPDIL